MENAGKKYHRRMPWNANRKKISNHVIALMIRAREKGYAANASVITSKAGSCRDVAFPTMRNVHMIDPSNTLPVW
jgi:hypothetical protein